VSTENHAGTQAPRPAAPEPELDPKAVENSIAELGTAGLVELVKALMTDLQASAENLLRALDHGDAAGAAGIAHALKSSSYYLGALKLSALCGEIERLGRQGALEAMQRLGPEFAERIRRFGREALALAARYQA
jgi:HPt (histidine-containing phosphotransfer) domain-containing protein